MDRLEAMAILVAVVERGSFTAAGRHLNLPLPTVSRKLAELEAHLGARLLTRSTRRLALTEAGDAYVAACKRILDDIGNAERAAAGEYVTAKGELVIAAPIVFGRLHVLPVIGTFLAANPEIDVRLLLSDRNAQLLDDHIDLAVRIGALPDSSLVAVRIGSVRRVVCGSPGYFSAHGVPETPGDLTKMSCVTFDAFGSAASWVFAGKPGERDRIVPIRSRLSVNTAEAALDAAISGVGLTRVLSYQAAPGVRDGTLRVVLEDFEAEPVPVNLLHGAHGQIPLKLRAFIDYAAPRLRARLADRPLNVRDSGTSFVSRCHQL